MATINPDPANPSDGSTGGSTPPSGGEDGGSALSSAIDGAEQIINILLENEILLIGLAVAIGLGYIAYQKYDRRVQEEYDGKDWKAIIISDLKYILNNAGFETNKDLTRGDNRELGSVYRYDVQEMPEGYEYEDLIFGNIDESDMEDDDLEKKEVYIFMTAPEGDISRAWWKVTDIYFDMNQNTNIYVVDSESVEEERTRFKLNEDIQFKREYDNIMMEKGVATENITDQFPLYQARKNIVEGLEEFSMKTLFLDRTHSASIAQKREDMDEQEILERLLGQGRNH